MPELAEQDMQTVVFKLYEQEYGVDIFRVQEIINIPSITSLPNTPDYLKGIINLRGSIIPVIDLKMKLMHTPSEYSDESKVIIIDVAAKKVGLIVDQVMEVAKIRAELVEQQDLAGDKNGADCLLGVAKREERLLIVLDINKLMN